MVKSILIVLTENFDDMMFLSSQVILEELGHDIIICSRENGTAKGENSSVMTVALSEALKQNEEYSGIILIDGSNFSDWELLNNALNQFNSQNKIIGFSIKSKSLLAKMGFEINQTDNKIIYQDNLLYLADASEIENFVNKFHQIISSVNTK
jgi:hypothetical protein